MKNLNKYSNIDDITLKNRLSEIDGELVDMHISAYKSDLLYKEIQEIKQELLSRESKSKDNITISKTFIHPLIISIHYDCAYELANILKSLYNYFKDKKTCFSFYFLKQNDFERKTKCQNLGICFDTLAEDVFRSIDVLHHINNEVQSLFKNSSCKYLICFEDLVNKDFVLSLCNSFEQKYGVVLELDENFNMGYHIKSQKDDIVYLNELELLDAFCIKWDRDWMISDILDCLSTIDTHTANDDTHKFCLSNSFIEKNNLVDFILGNWNPTMNLDVFLKWFNDFKKIKL